MDFAELSTRKKLCFIAGIVIFAFIGLLLAIRIVSPFIEAIQQRNNDYIYLQDMGFFIYIVVGIITVPAIIYVCMNDVSEKSQQWFLVAIMALSGMLAIYREDINSGLMMAMGSTNDYRICQEYKDRKYGGKGINWRTFNIDYFMAKTHLPCPYINPDKINPQKYRKLVKKLNGTDHHE